MALIGVDALAFAGGVFADRFIHTGPTSHDTWNGLSATGVHEEFKEIGILRMKVLALLDHLGLKAFALEDE